MKTDLKQLTREQMNEFAAGLGQKPYRAEQIIDWLYRKYAGSFDEMTNLSKDFRAELEKTAVTGSLRLLKNQVSQDGTQKFLFELQDGESIESVLIPNTRGPRRYTLCISSQAGCAMSCRFCVTGVLGFRRNLTASEIIDQVTSVSRFIVRHETAPDKTPSAHEHAITNIVFMGMGEPFNNFDAVIRAIKSLTDLSGYSNRKITVSTAGIVPRIYDFAGEAPGVNLAISLNATTDEERDLIMPVNKKYPLQKLLKACREFRLPPNRRITFEYVLLGGFNDSPEDAHRLVHLLKGIRSKVNLIPYNPAEHREGGYPAGGLELKRPGEESVTSFQRILMEAGITTIIRKSMGGDIAAACGQLKAGYG